LCIVALGLCTLALTFAQDHCDNIRNPGMTTAPLLTEVVPTTLYYLVHAIVRVTTYSLLSAYYPAFGFITIALMIATNFAVLSSDPILKWGCAKEFELWTENSLGRGRRVISAGMSLIAPFVYKGFQGLNEFVTCNIDLSITCTISPDSCQNVLIE
jgi:hypothetical protein